MKMADILRGLANKLDSIESGVQSEVEPPAEPKAQELDNNPVFVPPLQAKLEILKKSEGLPNVYDSEGAEEDELSLMKKRAGLTAAQHEASEDNDITG
jgi:hypothetical protein